MAKYLFGSPAMRINIEKAWRATKTQELLHGDVEDRKKFIAEMKTKLKIDDFLRGSSRKMAVGSQRYWKFPVWNIQPKRPKIKSSPNDIPVECASFFDYHPDLDLVHQMTNSELDKDINRAYKKVKKIKKQFNPGKLIIDTSAIVYQKNKADLGFTVKNDDGTERKMDMKDLLAAHESTPKTKEEKERMRKLYFMDTEFTEVLDYYQYEDWEGKAEREKKLRDDDEEIAKLVEEKDGVLSLSELEQLKMEIIEDEVANRHSMKSYDSTFRSAKEEIENLLNYNKDKDDESFETNEESPSNQDSKIAQDDIDFDQEKDDKIEKILQAEPNSPDKISKGNQDAKFAQVDKFNLDQDNEKLKYARLVKLTKDLKKGKYALEDQDSKLPGEDQDYKLSGADQYDELDPNDKEQVVGGDDDDVSEDEPYKLEHTPMFHTDTLSNIDIEYIKSEESEDEIDSSNYGKNFKVAKVDFIDERKKK